MDGAAIALAGGGATAVAYGLFSTRLRDRSDIDETMRAYRRYHRQFAPYLIGVGLALLGAAAVLFVLSASPGR